VTTDPRAALILDPSDLSEPTQRWIASLPTQNTVAEVFRRHMIGSAREDAREDRKRAQRLAQLHSDREDMADAYALRGEAIPTLADKFREWAALAELEERAEANAEARRVQQQRADERAIVAERRRSELVRDLAREKARHLQTLHDANQLGAAMFEARHGSAYRADEYGQPGGYRVRSGGPIVGGPY
jgi:hypothetical protein